MQALCLRGGRGHQRRNLKHTPLRVWALTALISKPPQIQSMSPNFHFPLSLIPEPNKAQALTTPSDPEPF